MLQAAAAEEQAQAEQVPEGQGLEGLDHVHDQGHAQDHVQAHAGAKLVDWQEEAQVLGHQNSALRARIQPPLLKKKSDQLLLIEPLLTPLHDAAGLASIKATESKGFGRKTKYIWNGPWCLTAALL